MGHLGVGYLKRCGDDVAFNFTTHTKGMASLFGGNLLVGQSSTEMLLDVGLQHCVEVLELSVSNQANDVYLADRRQIGLCIFITVEVIYNHPINRHVYLERDGQADTVI